MIVVMQTGAEQAAVDAVVEQITKQGLTPHLSAGEFRTIIGAMGEEGKLDERHLLAMDGVDKVLPVMKPYKLASREFSEHDTVVEVGGVKLGGEHATVLAGPCTVEDREMLWTIAGHVKKAGATILRGGAFKPRTSPYSFQGHGKQALEWLRECGDEHGMPTCTEVMDPRQVELVAEWADVLQIGARNMQNFDLLKEVGQTKRPVVLKRGLAATVKDWLLSAEYVLSQGNRDVILCERGIKTFEDSIRFSLDITSIPVALKNTHLPIVIDPSHAAGKRDFVPAIALAGMAAGAHGILIEVHHDPASAQCDGPQALLPATFETLMGQLGGLAQLHGRTLA
ncbi:MAG: 3-deoxy-7-phosphoheptulonate synthase [Planctomycetota bacterium]